MSSQPQYSLLWREPEEAVIPLCAAKGISQIVWSPLAQGVLSGKYVPGAARPARIARQPARRWASPSSPGCSPAILEAVQKLKPLAQQAGCTLAQFALAWVLREPNVASAIVGASRPEQLQENAGGVGPGRRSRPLRQSRGDRGRRGTRHLALAPAGRGRAPAEKKHYVTAMAQLSDDCFAFGGPMLSVEDAVALLASRLGVVEGSESVPLVQSDGRVLAQDLTAPLPLPPFTNSAVDGYALRGEDLPVGEEKTFPVADWIQAGASADPCRGTGPGHPHLHRRADAGRRRHGLHAGRRAGR